MSKFLQTAALVVGGVALAATGVGLAIGATAAAAAGSAGIGALSVTTLAEAAGAAATGLSLAAGLTAHKPSAGGNPDQWSANPDAGIPIVLGYGFNAGQIVYRRGYRASAKTNKYETIFTVWSLGPVGGISKLYVDNVLTAVNPDGSVAISDRGVMYEVRQLGLCPEAAALMPPPVTPAGWTAAHKLSGKAATGVTFVYDAKGSHTFTATPACGWAGQGVKCYDPRKDSTYPGGDGAHRIDDETTWEWSDNPYVVGLTWCIGWRQNGKLAGGVGLDPNGILIDQFVEGANIADANGWKVGGVVYTTDDKWDVLKNILQAGGGRPLRLAAQLGCLVNAPKVSLATVTHADLRDEPSAAGATPRRSRINAVSPRYTAEQVQVSDGKTLTQFGTITGTPIVVDAYVTADGRQRRKQIDYPLVQHLADGSLDQVAQLARYDIENLREFGPITLPLRIRWMGYRPGDCITVDLPEIGLNDQDVLLNNRSLDAETTFVTLTATSETAAKHGFALGQTTTAPATPELTAYDPSVDAPAPDAWTITGITLSSSAGSLPAIEIDGACDNDGASAVLFELRPHVDGQADDAGWETLSSDAPTVTRKVITSVSPATAYDVAVSYVVRGVIGDRLILGPATAGDLRTADMISTMIRNSYVKCDTSPLVANDAGDGTGTVTIADTIWDYPGATAEVSRTGGTLTGLDLGTRYYVYFDDSTLLDETPAYVATTSLAEASNSTSTPYRHNMGSVDVPAAGGGSTPGGGDAGGGSACPSPSMYLLAKGRGKVRADALTAADYVWGRHEITGVWDWYQISAIGPVTGPIYRATIGGREYETTGSHLWELPGDRAWRQMAGIRGAQAIGDGDAVAIEVTDAHTYLLFASADDPVGVLSHNKLMNPIGD